MSKKWKHAIVIGASGGIGEALVYELAKQGVSVAFGSQTEEELERVATAANKVSGFADQVSGGSHESRTTNHEPRFPVFVHDVTNFSEVPALFQEITKQLGGLDLIIYNSGIMPACCER